MASGRRQLKPVKGLKRRSLMQRNVTSTMSAQLGRSENDIALPEFEALNVDSLENFKFTSKEPEVIRRSIEVDIAQDLGASGGKVISTQEARDIEATRSGRDWQVRSSVTSMVASTSHYIPTFNVNLHFWGLGGQVAFWRAAHRSCSGNI